MIVRTYGRRSRAISKTYSDRINNDVHDPFRDSLSQESSQDQLYSLPFSSQESSSHWSAFDSDPYNLCSTVPTRVSFDEPCNGVVRKSKKARIGKKDKEVPRNFRPSIPATSTLMEAQEFGEMMEHVDEVNFALDGLRKGQPVQIKRASLVSLLSICGTAHQRRLLRTQGMAKTIIDAIQGLSLDDSPSNLAASALFYILTKDGQDDHLLESPSCVCFLIKLLKPIISTTNEDKPPKLGSKLLALCKDADVSKDRTRRLDSSTAAVVSKVQEILVSCKEIGGVYGDDIRMERPELCPKWLSLLTMEKACLSSISLDETTGAVRKSGGNFKEKLQEHGGLDAVFEVAMKCHSDMEGLMEHCSPSTQDAKRDVHLESLVLLLKCLKIMENATFLSKDNQSHLLGMKGKLSALATPLSFTELIISVIKVLSDLYLRKKAPITSTSKSSDDSTVAGDASELALIADHKGGNDMLSINSSRKYCGKERIFSDKSSDVSQNSQLLSSGRLDSSISCSETTNTSTTGSYLLKIGVNSSTSGSFSGASRSSNSKTAVTYNCSRKITGLTVDDPIELLDDSQDPFAFDEDDFKPSKWDLLSGEKKVSRTKACRVTYKDLQDGGQSQINTSQEESSNGVDNSSHSCTFDEEDSGLLADCLLTAVKVLMNLTNDNPVGCRQIAAFGGLETMSSLIAFHFPSFSSSSTFVQINENTSSSELDQQHDRHLNDRELDFLVAILGLLVNLVEKDGHNRSRLAAATVPLPTSEGLEEKVHRNVIQLLCSVFLANQGGGDDAGEDKHLTWSDEAAVLQGEKEAEKMIVEAYAALLLAFLSTESKSIREAISAYLPDRKLAILVPVLDRFVEFHLTLDMISPETHKAVTEVIESCRIP
ncbi:WAPL (Wings apart-like protein regulation of heterochromatin) protein [Quillaja saponaria]|uniref:WAPL (Wings apart-like protein regulation of heterochromatin) protein n=1 Tax=Quillaja saponaria TaxID=32244 RepID=A0AAD7M226_QUISA|nr:WAPL (Wings apart-like protein regulation of heterochromatin) protein [Quillaja saponaria]